MKDEMGMIKPKMGLCENCTHSMQTRPDTGYYACKLQSIYIYRVKCNIGQWHGRNS